MDIKETEKIIDEIKTKKSQQDFEPKTNNYYSFFSIVGFLGVLISIGIGFYKMLIYENPDSYFEKSINAHVGGDAYNFIINGTHATAYFVLALVFMVFTSTMMILNKIDK